MKLIKINESQRQRLFEAYYGDLYHFTTLSHLYSMLKTNCIYRVEDEYGHKDSRMGYDSNVVCLTRSIKSGYRKSCNDVRITLDGSLLSSSLRHNKIHPYNYYERSEEDNPQLSGEFEERLYGNDIYPLSKYCKSIDIYIGNINRVDYGFCDDIETAYEALENESNTNPSDRDINEWFLKHIITDFPQWKNKINIHKFEQ